MRRDVVLLVALLQWAGFGIGADAQDWGDLRVTFVYDGEPPAPRHGKIAKDTEYRGKFGAIQEDLVVNPENRGIANVVAYLHLGPGDNAPQPHPSYEETAADEVLLDNKKYRFEPHVALLRTSQSLILGNSDDVGYNCKIDALNNRAINFTVPAKGKRTHRFTKVERWPSKVTCSVHPWMSGWVVVKDNPYMALSDKNGKIVIKNLPVGSWTIQFWQEKSGYVDSVTLDGKSTQWKQGRMQLTIASGLNDLGTVKLAPALFEE